MDVESQELCRLLLIAQYLGVLKRAAEKAEPGAKQKVILVPGACAVASVQPTWPLTALLLVPRLWAEILKMATTTWPTALIELWLS